MALLVIEGDPWAIKSLAEELVDRNYLNEFYSTVIEAPEIITEDKWLEFIHSLITFR